MNKLEIEERIAEIRYDLNTIDTYQCFETDEEIKAVRDHVASLEAELEHLKKLRNK